MTTNDKKNWWKIKHQIKNQIFRRLYRDLADGKLPARFSQGDMADISQAAASALMNDERLDIVLKKGN